MNTKNTLAILIACLFLNVSQNSFSQFSSFQKLFISDLSTVYGTASFHTPGIISPSPEQIICFSAMMATPGKFDIAMLKLDSSGAVTGTKMLTKNPGFHDWVRGFVKFGDYYYMTGSSRAFDTSSFSYESSYLVKFDSNLNILSQTNYFLPNREIFARAITATLDNNILIAGTSTFSTITSAFLLKTDTNGNVIWFKRYQAPVDITYIRELFNGDIMVCGSLSYSFQNIHPIAMRFNSNGNLLWAMNFAFTTGPFAYQQSALEFIHDFGNGNILLAGRTEGVLAINSMDSYAIMMDGLGNITWSKVFGASQIDWTYGYSVTSNNNLVITGRTNSFFNNSNCGFVQVIDTSGALLSSYAFGDTSMQELTLTGFHEVSSLKNMVTGFQLYSGTYNLYTADFSSAPVGLCPVYPVSFTTANAAYPVNTFGVITDSTLILNTNNDNFNTYTGINELLLCNLGTPVEENSSEENSLEIYPNPAVNQFTIYDLRFTIERIEIFNALGKKMFSQKLIANSQNRIVIDISELESGIYFLKLKTADGINIAEKIIVVDF